MTGEQVLAAYNQAKALVLAGKYEEARAVEVFPSDRIAIERLIERESGKDAKGNEIE